MGVVMALGAGMITAGVIVGAADGTGPRPPVRSGVGLVAFDSCASALTEMKDRISPYVGPYGLDFGGMFGGGDEMMTADGAESGAGRMAVPEAPAEDMAASAPKEGGQPPGEGDYSTTNVHEAGVDEPDVVKTDGKRVVSVTDGVLRVVDVASHAQTAVVRLDGEGGGYPTNMLLSGDRALVMTSAMVAYSTPGFAPGEPTAKPAPDEPTPMPAPDEPTPTPAPSDTFPFTSRLVLVDLTGAGKVIGTLSVDGDYLDARQVGGVARVVVRSMPRLQFKYPEGDGSPVSSLLDNKDIVANSAIEDWLPRYELKTGAATSSGQLTECADVSHPANYTASGMLTVLTFDLAKELGAGDPVTIVADGNTVYGTGENLYIADDGQMMSGAADMRTRSPGTTTNVYQFDVSAPGKPVHVATGSVPGALLNQYSRKENQLTQVGQVSGLGPGERIYAVRYFGDTAYVVTFRETDPLYTVDLSDPAAPKVTGELKITGYSAYLHPAGDGRLIGVGQEANETGGVLGAQVSLFDVSNPAGATRIAQYHVPDSWSEVQNDPHAFLYWPEKNLLVMPVSGTMDGKGGALVLRLNDNKFEQAALLGHMSAKYGDMPMVPRRALVIGDELWTVSEAGMLVNDLNSLAQLAWLPFS
jgi:hypothetical protein